MSEPSFSKTYRSVDGELIGDFGWVTELEHFECDFEPRPLIEETWTRTDERVVWAVPSVVVYECVASPEDCDGDAVGWFLRDDKPIAACKVHGAGLPRLENGQPPLVVSAGESS